MQELLPTITILAAALSMLTGIKLFVAWKRLQVKMRTEDVTLLIRTSRESERHPIVAEQLFSVLHSAHHDLSLTDYFAGRTQEEMSFEIAHHAGQVKFLMHIPKKLQVMVEGQIYAQYPDAEIEETVDILKELPKPVHALALHLEEPDIFPIKRYVQFEDKIKRTVYDPLSGITAALSRMPYPQDSALIQLVISPKGDHWRKRALRCVRILGKGIFLNISALQNIYARVFMTESRIIKTIFFPVYILLWFQGILSGTGVKLFSVEQGHDEVIAEESGSEHKKEDPLHAAMDKAGKLPFDASLRILYASPTASKAEANAKLKELAGSFKQFNQPHINSLLPLKGDVFSLQHAEERSITRPFVLSSEELATLWHLPNLEVKTPNMVYVTSRKLEPPVDLPDPAREQDLTLLGRTAYRGVVKEFGIRQEDRRRHIYVIGKTGMGKSTLLENMIVSDIREGKGVAVVDPHGDLADHVLANIPSHRTNDVVVFDPSDREFPLAFNMLENIDPRQSSVVASGLIGIFKKIYAESWGPRLEHILRNTVLALLEYQNATMLGIIRMLSDASFRERVVRKIEDPIVRQFWLEEFAKMPDKQRVEAISPIQNKVGQFLSSPIIRNIVGQPKSQVNLRWVMDNKKIFICNLSKGKIGEDSSSLLGSMIITKFQLDAMSRSDIPEKDRVDFYLYVDEFQNFATDSFATILSEARKYRLNLTMANQYIAQMSEEVQGAVFGNVGTTLTFQVGFDDAEYLSKQFSEIVLPNDLVQLPKYNMYAKLLVDGMPTLPFSSATLPPIPHEAEADRAEKVLKISRERYATPREVVEEKIKRWSRSDDEKGEVRQAQTGDTPRKQSAVTGERKPNTNGVPRQSAVEKAPTATLQERPTPTERKEMPKQQPRREEASATAPLRPIVKKPSDPLPSQKQTSANGTTRAAPALGVALPVTTLPPVTPFKASDEALEGLLVSDGVPEVAAPSTAPVQSAAPTQRTAPAPARPTQPNAQRSTQPAPAAPARPAVSQSPTRQNAPTPPPAQKPAPSPSKRVVPERNVRPANTAGQTQSARQRTSSAAQTPVPDAPAGEIQAHPPPASPKKEMIPKGFRLPPPPTDDDMLEELAVSLTPEVPIVSQTFSLGSKEATFTDAPADMPDAIETPPDRGPAAIPHESAAATPRTPPPASTPLPAGPQQVTTLPPQSATRPAIHRQPSPQPRGPARPQGSSTPPLTQAEYQRAVQYLAYYEKQYRMPRPQAWQAAVTAVLQQRRR